MVKTLDRLLITRWEESLLTALFSEKQAIELGLEEENASLGNIYIGKVNRIVKNLNSAFVDYGPGRTGYYSLTDNPVILHADGRRDNTLKAGDEIIVQVAKEAVRTKDPVLTSNLNFTGRYAVLTAGKTMIGFSSKIGDKIWKDEIKPKLEALTGKEAGLIVRTNGYGREEALLREAEALMEEYRQILNTARYRTCYTLLAASEPEYVKTIRNCPAGTLKEIVTDDPGVYENLTRCQKQWEQEQRCPIRFYEDPKLSLTKLYSLEAAMEQASQKRVWLKSGGYLIIEYTEAMTVIDVHTGKYAGKKNQDDTIRMTNIEAAKEISRQLRLRNLSGIIMVDFIDMKRQEDKELLMESLREFVRPDPIKTTVVDMTPLNLVELTRKKTKKPLWEQLASQQKKQDKKGTGE